MSNYLDRLCNTGWKLAPLLHCGQRPFWNVTLLEWSGQYVCRRNGVLNRKVYAHAASGRHRMSRIADA